MIPLLVVALAALPGDTGDVWDDLERLVFEAPPEAERSELRARAWEGTEGLEGPERALAEEVLIHLEGGAPELAVDLEPWPFDARRSWLAAVVLPEGPVRAHAVATAVAALDPARAPELSGARLGVAWEAWLAASLDLRFDDALAIGRPVHADQRADWSAQSLALGLARAGLTDEADRILTEQMPRTSARAALWTQKGIALWGAGRDVPGRRALGIAMLLGSVDASTVVARLDLAAGRLPAARAGFRAALASGEPGPWARRGWGLSQLGPRVPERPSARRGW